MPALAFYGLTGDKAGEKSTLGLKATEASKPKLLALSWSYAFANRKAAA